MNITGFFKMTAALAALCAATAGQAATVNVFAAASLTDALKEIARNYASRSPNKIEFNFAASSILARQIEEGATADIFFSADEAKMDALDKKNLVEKKSRRDRLSNSLVIVEPADGPALLHSPQDLASDKITHIALGDPKAVPAGIYARAYLEKIQLWAKVEPKVVPMASVRAALAAVESGDAQAGIVYKTDAAISKKTRVAVEIPRADGPPIRYPMAQIKESKEPAAARAFLEYLDSDDAGKVFRRFGFIVDTRAHDGQ